MGDDALAVELNDRLGSKTGGVCSSSPRGPRSERRSGEGDDECSDLLLLLIVVGVVGTSVPVRVRAVVCDDPAAGEATPCLGVVCAAASTVYSSSSSWSSSLSASPSRCVRVGVAGIMRAMKRSTADPVAAL